MTYVFLFRCPRCGRYLACTAVPGGDGMFRLTEYCQNSEHGYTGSEGCIYWQIPLEVVRVDAVAAAGS